MSPRLLTLPFLALLALLVGVAAPAAAEPIPGLPETTVGLPFTLSVQGANGRSEVLAPVPDGANPLRLTGEITANYNYPGTVTVDIGGRRAAEVDAMKGGPVDIALEPGDLVDGALPVTMLVRLTSEEDCFADDNASATLKDARLTYQYPATPPDTVGTFLSPGILRYTVVVSPDAGTAAQSAALNAVSALTLRFPSPTVVDLQVTDTAPEASFQERVVVIEEAPGTTLTVADGTLTVAGEGDGLTSAAAALGSDNLDLIDQVEASDVTASPQFEVRNDPVSLAELGIATWQTAGIGKHSADIGINQPAFGQQLEALTVALTGSVTPVPEGGQGRVDFLWNGLLLDSVTMAETSALKSTLKIPADLLRRDNTLTLQMSFIPPGGKCFPRGIDGRVDIDTAGSTVTPKAGTSVPPGFERFPQAFGAQVPVTLEPAGDDAALRQAGLLVAALQSSGSQQFTYQVADEGSGAESQDAGIVVGESSSTATEFKAPLQDSTLTSLGQPDQVFAAALTEPFAGLQAFAGDGRDLVLLNAFGDEQTSAPLATALAGYANQPPLRWSKLEKQVVVMGTDEVAVTSSYTQPAQPDKTRTLLIATIVGFALVALAVLLWLWRRPRGEAEPPPGAAA